MKGQLNKHRLTVTVLFTNISCPGCGTSCIGKIERTYERTVEQAQTDSNSAVYKHFNNCTGIQHFLILLLCIRHLHSTSAPVQNSDKFDIRARHINLAQNNTEITDRNKNWNILFFKKDNITSEELGFIFLQCSSDLTEP